MPISLKQPETPSAASTKQSQVLAQLRHWLAYGGGGAPGRRLPTHRALAQQFGVSSLTVQRAVEQLARDGLLVCRGRAGTFVANRPPYTNRYAVVFNHSMNDSHYLRSVAEAALSLDRESPDVQISCYQHVRPDSHSEDMQRLEQEIEAHRLAGVIFTFQPKSLYEEGSPIVTRPGLPRVALVRQTDLPEVHPFRLNDGFLRLAFRRFDERGCKRVAMLVKPYISMSYVAEAQRFAAEHGMTLLRRDIQAVDPSNPQWAANCVESIFTRDTEQRPDGLLINDDHLVESATFALTPLLSTNATTADSPVCVIASCNDPYRPHAACPVHWLGVDLDASVRQLIGTIENIRSGTEERLDLGMSARFLDAEKNIDYRSRNAVVAKTQKSSLIGD